MKRLTCLFVIFSSILFCACRESRSEWQSFASEAGNFSVSAPGALLESATMTDTPLGQVDSHVFTLHRGAYGYAVAYTDYPVPGIARANPLGALEGGVLDTLNSYSAKLVKEDDVFLGDALGIEFSGEFLGGKDFDAPGIVYGRVYLFDARLYQLTVVAQKEQIKAADPERFLASFQWLETGGQDMEVSK